MLREVLLSRGEGMDSRPLEQVQGSGKGSGKGSSKGRQGTILFINRKKGGESNGRYSMRACYSFTIHSLE
jgi:hypothetical protein